MIYKGFITVSFLFLFIVLWGNRIEPRWLDVTHHSVTIEDVPEAFDGSEVAFISDLQLGMWLGNESTISAAVKEIIKRQPIAVLIGGDFIYHPTDEDYKESKEEWQEDDKKRSERLVSKVTNLLSPITEAGIKTFAVLGNHDYSMGKSSARRIERTAQLLQRKLSEVGIRVLNNENVAIVQNSENINIVGIAPHYPDLDNVSAALQGLREGVRVLFMHNSNSIRDLNVDEYDLAIAGHTHGGQIRVPFLEDWSWTSLVPHTPDEVWGDGWIEKVGEGKLYINRGIGFSSLPLRLNCRPELSFFKLTNSSSSE